MTQPQYPIRVSEPEARSYWIRFEGASAADPDNELGAGVAVTWVSTGRYRVTFTESPGRWVGAPKPGFQATTPADVDTWDAVLGAYDSTNKRIDVYVYSSAGNLADLAAGSWLFLDLRFKNTSVTG
jgi:hypothetical protein